MKITDSAHRLQELLNVTGDNQNEMAKKTKIAKSTISRYLNGERIPKQDKISIISDAYHINPAWLMGYDVPMENKKDDTDIQLFFNSLMNDIAYKEADLEEIKKAIEKANDSDTSKALKMYDMFLNAPAHIQSAVESLLKGSQQES